MPATNSKDLFKAALSPINFKRKGDIPVMCPSHGIGIPPFFHIGMFYFRGNRRIVIGLLHSAGPQALYKGLRGHLKVI